MEADEQGEPGQWQAATSTASITDSDRARQYIKEQGANDRGLIYLWTNLVSKWRFTDVPLGQISKLRTANTLMSQVKHSAHVLSTSSLAVRRVAIEWIVQRRRRGPKTSVIKL
jgi:hypothetical protein